MQPLTNSRARLFSAVVGLPTYSASKEQMRSAGIIGMTVSEVRGFGRQKGQVERYRASENF